MPDRLPQTASADARAALTDFWAARRALARAAKAGLDFTGATWPPRAAEERQWLIARATAGGAPADRANPARSVSHKAHAGEPIACKWRREMNVRYDHEAPTVESGIGGFRQAGRGSGCPVRASRGPQAIFRGAGPGTGPRCPRGFCVSRGRSTQGGAVHSDRARLGPGDRGRGLLLHDTPRGPAFRRQALSR